MKVPLLDLKGEYETYKAEALEAIRHICETQTFALGPAVASFERRIADYCGARFAIGVSSGSDALLVSLMAMGIGDGDEVITTPFTFFATAAAIARLGANPVFVDIDQDTFNIDTTRIESRITTRSKAIVPVHLFGQAAKMKPIVNIARKHGLAVVEDAAQAIGASQNGLKCGNFGTAGCFSFYPTKNLSCFGDGGLVITSDKNLAEKIRCLRNHGQTGQYIYEQIGGNFRLDAIQAAVLQVKLKYLDKWNRQRRQNAAFYDKLFADTPISAPKIAPDNFSIYHQYTIKSASRDELKNYLLANGIASAVFYPKPLHLQECFGYLGYKKGDFPVAEKICSEVLSLPVYPQLTEEQISYVADTALGFHKAGRKLKKC